MSATPDTSSTLPPTSQAFIGTTKYQVYRLTSGFRINLFSGGWGIMLTPKHNQADVQNQQGQVIGTVSGPLPLMLELATDLLNKDHAQGATSA